MIQCVSSASLGLIRNIYFGARCIAENAKRGDELDCLSSSTGVHQTEPDRDFTNREWNSDCVHSRTRSRHGPGILDENRYLRLRRHPARCRTARHYIPLICTVEARSSVQTVSRDYPLGVCFPWAVERGNRDKPLSTDGYVSC